MKPLRISKRRKIGGSGRGWSISTLLHFTLSCLCYTALAETADRAFHGVSVPSARSAGRELPNRMPVIEFVCSAEEKICNDHYTLLEEPEQWESAHDILDVRVPKIVRMSVTRIWAMPISAEWLCKQFWCKRLTMTLVSYRRSQRTP